MVTQLEAALTWAPQDPYKPPQHSMPRAFPSRVHVPNSGPPELSHTASLERKQEGPCQEVLC